MAIVLRLPKRQLRMALAGLTVIALGAAVAAQTTTPPRAEPAAAVTSTAPQETALPTPTAASAVQESPSPTAQDPQSPPAQEPQSPPEQQETPPAQQETPPQQPAPGTPGSRQQLLTPQEQEAIRLVEQLIQDQEGVLMGTGFDYDAGGRRDPFRSLLAQITAVSAPTVRPFGLPGFLINEVDLKAIAEVQGRWHAMVTAPDQRAYFLEVGTELFDGHVVRIEPGEVIFEQIVPDLSGARRTREVTKRLRTDGGGETP